ncbi:MAG: hypothetical protein JSU70_19740 [Phycisphaerales bacterium]|nr:MAG: hypothetical protein JSU70_19740 [Phycisphaerales bacterium]
MDPRLVTHIVATIVALVPCLTLANERVTREEAARALRKAAGFFHSQVSCNGGYLWNYSGDLTLREGEGKAGETMAWVQPPGTPTVGEVFIDAYETTSDEFYRDAARDVASALLRGQLRSGGWFYHIEFDPEKRLEYGYRDVPKRKKQKQKTTLDDDTTQTAVRFLMRLDKTLPSHDQGIHEAVTYALNSMLAAQYPNGGWYQWYDKYPSGADPNEYPTKAASYPETWSRVWLNDWTGCYFINDNVMTNMILTMLMAYETYGDRQCLQSALKAGDFLLLAQMPDPQPAWAQQYDKDMHPVWDRKFEPPAISGRESQDVLEALCLLYRKTARSKYLEPIPRAISYLRKSALEDGRLARFYELNTNRPLYFRRTGKRYDLTYSSDDIPEHYAFMVGSRLDSIEAEYHRLLRTDPQDLSGQDDRSAVRMSPALLGQARRVIDSLDDRGAWVEKGRLRHHKIEPESGVIRCQTFVRNVRTLCRFLNACQ